MASIDQTSLGRRLKEARIGCRLTQDEVAEHLGIPRTAVVNIESGERAVRPHGRTATADIPQYRHAGRCGRPWRNRFRQF